MSTAEPTSPPVARPLPAGLRSLVRWVRAGVLVGAATLLVVPPMFWLNPGWVASAGPAAAGLPLGSAFSVDPVARALGAAASLPGIVLGGWMLWQLWCLFGEYAAGRVFGATAQHRLHRLGSGLLGLALLGPVQRLLMALALTWGNPPGQRMLVLQLGWHDYLGLLTAAVLLAVATVMGEASRIAAENDGFV